MEAHITMPYPRDQIYIVPTQNHFFPRHAHVNPFVPTAPFLYPVKTLENLAVF